jgi:hypothetical protein
MSEETKLENTTDGGLSSTDLLAAWKSYCGNPDSMYPCENFKAGWKSGRMDMEGITEQDIDETMPPNVRCFLDDPEMPQCCCNCVHHISIRKPWVECGKRGTGDCDCGTHKEWGCAGFISEGKVIGNWPEHSCGCEMYSPNESKP